MLSKLTSGLVLLALTCGLLSNDPAQKPAQKLNIICDLGGVLIDTNVTAAFWHIGPLRYLYYYASTFPHTKSTRHLLYYTFERLRQGNSEETHACDSEGNILPQIMCDWLKGTEDTYSLLLNLTKEIDAHPEYFINAAEQSMARSLISLIFNPDAFIKSRCWLPEGLQFIKECKEKGHNLYLLSNWDGISFNRLREQFPEIFDQFDGWIISGDCKLLKPDPAIFDLLFDKYDLDPNNCLFIDDQKENIIAAQKRGVTSILVQPRSTLLTNIPDFTLAQQEIAQWATC